MSSDEIVVDKREFIVYDAGLYRARVQKLEKVDSIYGEQIKFTFRLLDGDDPEATVLAWASLSYSDKSKLFKWAKALIGEQFDPKAPFRSSLILGKEAMLELEVKTTSDGLEVNRVMNVIPIRERKPKAQQQPARNNEQIMSDLGYDTPGAVSVSVASATSGGKPEEPPLWD